MILSEKIDHIGVATTDNSSDNQIVDLCKKINADFIIRGLRNPADFEFEKAIGPMENQGGSS